MLRSATKLIKNLPSLSSLNRKISWNWFPAKERIAAAVIESCNNRQNRSPGSPMIVSPRGSPTSSAPDARRPIGAGIERYIPMTNLIS